MDNAVQVRGHREGHASFAFVDRHHGRKKAAGLCFAAILAVAVAVVGFFLGLPLSAAAPLELLVVLVTALYLGLLEASVASVVAVLCLDFLFTRPLFQFIVDDPQNWIALTTFEAIALIVSSLSYKVRVRTKEAEEEKRRALTLYELSRAILHLQQSQPIAAQLSPLVRELARVDEVIFWTTTEEPSKDPSEQTRNCPAPYEVYLGERNADDAANRTSTRVLRLGVKAIGGMTLKGWRPDPLMADAVASLSALAFERAHAIRRESRVEIERDTEQLRTAVLDGLAHSFKTPLTAIRTVSSGLLAVGQLSAMQTELISIIDDRATMLTQLTTQLLQTAALDAKHIRLQRTSIDLAELLERVLQGVAATDRPRISVQPPSIRTEASIDVPLVELAVQQLLDNGLKYSPPNTGIVIMVMPRERETVFAVENVRSTRSAIDPEKRDRLFERYQRGEQTGYGPAGTGLGLSIVRQIAEAHGGRAWIEGDEKTTRFLLSVARHGGRENE